MRICNSCMVFVMEFLSLQWGIISIDIRIGDYLTDVYSKGCVVIWEKQALSWCVHLLAVEDVVCGIRRMCWISCTVTHQPALVTFLLQQDDFRRDQHGVLWVRIIYISLMHNRWQQGTNMSVYGLLDSAAQDYIHLNVCTVARHEEDSLCRGSSGLRQSN
jgi:hypothetical protein